MSWLTRRLPTRREGLLIFTLVFVIVYSWSILSFFNYLPSWLLYLDGWTIAGIFAYSQVFALFESLLALAAVSAAAVVLPQRLFRERFVAQGVIVVLLAAAGAIALQVLKQVPLWPSKTLIAGLLAYLGAVAAASWWVRRHAALQAGIERLADRLVTLLYIYLPLVALSAVILLVRNIF
ncbi:MAG TPA: hypothetical protein VFF68_06920 [Anaerolineaceae bacterium]|nr:hypothetical protein [Anaerolineaceae bacterium]